MTIVNVSARKILSSLWRGGQYAYLWTDNGKRSKWFQIDESTTIPADWKDSNIYFSIHPCAAIPTHNSRGEKVQASQVRSQIKTITAINCVFGEFDAKDEVSTKEYAPFLPDDFDTLTDIAQKTAIKTAKEQAVVSDLAKFKQRAFLRVENSARYPTLIVDSGGGYHAYWIFVEPVMITDANRTHVQEVQAAWVDLIGCDPVSKDLARVLRVPGTSNVKPQYAPNFPIVSVIEYDETRIYSFAEIEQLTGLDEVTTAAKQAQQRTKKDNQDKPTDNVIAEFNRTHHIVDMLVDEGYTLGWERPEVARLSRPGRDKGQTSVIVFKSGEKEMSYHHSSSDPLYTIGHCRDAFDIFTATEHKGDAKLAYEAAKREQGKWTENRSSKRQAIDPLTGEILQLETVKPTTYTNGHTNGNGNGYHAAESEAPKTSSEPVIDFKAIMSRIQSILNNAEMVEWQRNAAIIKELSLPISYLEPHEHIEIEVVLADKRLGFTKTEAKQFIKSCVALRKRRDKEAEKLQQLEEHRKRAEQSDAVTAKFGGHEIQTNNRQIKEVGDQALAAILDHIAKQPDQPLIYIKGGMLARVAKDEDDLHLIQTATTGSIYVALGEVARWVNVREGQNGEEKFDVFPPQSVSNYLYNCPDWPGIPAIESIVNTPVFGKNGVFHTTPGYNEKTRLYYTGGVELGDTTPTSENVAKAKELIIGDMLIDFPFKDDASHAHAIAYMLLPFVRQMIDGPTPLHMIESPTPGTGKGKLVNACAYISLGHDAPTISELEDDAEWRKALTAFLMTGRTHLCIDNVNHGIDSGVLANALTQPYWSDRILGANREISIKINAVWSATGNNVPISEEIARRCVLCRLDANVERPWERTGFKHENLMDWVRSNRNELVTACCTLIRAWLEKGKPKFSGKAKGSYEAWTNVMGGILEASDIAGFLQNENEMFNKTINANELMADFVKAWWTKFHEDRTGECSVSSGQLFKLASYSDDDMENRSGEWTNLLGDMLGTGKQRARQTKLGIILREMSDKVIGNYKICQGKINQGQRHYTLQKV